MKSLAVLLLVGALSAFSAHAKDSSVNVDKARRDLLRSRAVQGAIAQAKQGNMTCETMKVTSGTPDDDLQVIAEVSCHTTGGDEGNTFVTIKAFYFDDASPLMIDSIQFDYAG